MKISEASKLPKKKFYFQNITWKRLKSRSNVKRLNMNISRAKPRETENDNFALHKNFFIFICDYKLYYYYVFVASVEEENWDHRNSRCRLRQKKEINIHYFIMIHRHDME